MNEEAIEFHSKDIEFELLHQDEIRIWINQIARKHHKTIHHLSIIFVSDEELLRMNREFLNHDFYTDILSFPYSDPKHKEIVGDLYISIDRVNDNADELKENFIDELHRVIIHGLLHFIGLDDSSEADKLKMRKEENLALSLRMF